MKKIPIRTCIGCNESKAKPELIRIVKTPEEDVLIDFSGKKNGRGAYICCSVSCLDKAIKSRRLVKAFQIQINNEIYENLRQEIVAKTEVEE